MKRTIITGPSRSTHALKISGLKNTVVVYSIKNKIADLDKETLNVIFEDVILKDNAATRRILSCESLTTRLPYTDFTTRLTPDLIFTCDEIPAWVKIEFPDLNHIEI